MSTSKRGLFFTIDALIAALILIAGLFLITSSYVSEQPRTIKGTMSQDMLNILSELRVYEVNNSYIQSLVDDGNITDVNSTLLNQMGEFWTQGNDDLAFDFAENVSEGLLSAAYGYGIYFDGDRIYSRSVAMRNSLISSKRLITGIERSKPMKGFIAKAHATSIHKVSTLVVPFAPSGSGWKGSTDFPGTLETTKYFDLPNVTIFNATAYLSLHIDRGSTDWNVVTVNDGRCNITRNDLNLAPGNEGVFRIVPMDDDCFMNGTNSVKIVVKNNGYNAHIHPGTFFVIVYNLTENVNPLYSHHSERIYFDNIHSIQGGGVSGAGPWVINSFNIPTDATDIKVYMKIAGMGIYDYTEGCSASRRFWGWGGWRCFKDYDYMVFLNDNVPMDYKGTVPTNPVYNYTPAQLSSRVINGTNIVAVYFNNFEDMYWGRNNETIYSDPANNASGSSYIEVNYTMSPLLDYGVIEVRQMKEFGGLANPLKDSNFSFPAETAGAAQVLIHPVEQYSYILQAFADTGFPPGNQVFESPSARAVPSSIYVPPEYLDGTPGFLNYIRLREESGDDVLPNSTIDYGFYIKGLVGYGEVFMTMGEAVEDAAARLSELLGMYVDPANLVVENSSMSAVPSLWGPAIAEVRVWD